MKHNRSRCGAFWQHGDTGINDSYFGFGRSIRFWPMSDTGEFDLACEAITRSIIGAFFEVYNILGFGFLESVYTAALADELTSRGHQVAREVAVRVTYKDKAIAWHRIDLLVDGCVVVECKAGDHLPPTARLQLRNYLKGTGLEVGLLLHFGPKATITRVFSSKTK